MKKIDFHIHTRSTVSDSPFIFDLDTLKEYVNKLSIDAIAITNHNCFDLNQFSLIESELGQTMVFPGIEVNLENGHVLVIAPKERLSDFNSSCKQISELISANTDSLDMNQFKKIFHDLENYLIIPHYYKEPKLGKTVLKELEGFIEAGEVQSPKKWTLCQKEKGLTPVIFSDFRCATIDEDNENFQYPSRQTYLDCDSLTIPKIKLMLKDKKNVSLDIDNQENIFQLLPDGTIASTGLNVVLGKRSSGKTHTLNTIYNTYGAKNIKYIKQFDLIKRSSDEIFNQIIEREQDEYTEEYFKEIKQLTQYLLSFDREQNLINIDNYIESLKNYALNKEKDDIYSRVKLFTETLLDKPEINKLKKIIDSIIMIVDDKDYDVIISERINKDDLKLLILDLIQLYGDKKLNSLCIEETNIIIEEIKQLLGRKSALNPIEEVDFKEQFKLMIVEDKFNNLIEIGGKRRIVNRTERFNFSIEAEVSRITRASDLNRHSGSKNTGELFSEELTAFEYYQRIKKDRNKYNIPLENVYKTFWQISYNVKNSFEKNLSGGEKAEYNLLAELKDSFKYDIVLIDEPESSFDNEFIKKNVIKAIRDIAIKATVFVVTHNNTIGLLLEPDNIIYTEKEMTENGPEYYVYTGKLTSKYLNSICGRKKNNYLLLMEAMEAGEDAYLGRKDIYETIKD